MKHCAKCQLIYDEHAKKCDRCEGTLTSFEPGHDIHDLNMVFPEGAEWVIIESALQEYEAQSHIDYLKSVHIPAIKVLQQDGVLSEVYLGKSNVGYDVFVPEKMKDLAETALEAYLNAPFDSEMFKDNIDETE